jgi:crotonobetainyl-CoA:carnitine CoA-transferase CaiB-like acyl-CoA transferase
MQNAKSATALGAFRVFDLSESIAGQFCCRMLADYGADVTLVEPPQGSATRRLPPFGQQGDESTSPLFHHLNLGKNSLIVDGITPQGRDVLGDLAKVADVFVVPAGFDRAALRQLNSRLIVAVVSPFGEDGPKRDWRGTEMIYQAMSGMMIQNGRNDREPLYGVGERASYCAGIATYSAILSALLVRERTGIAQEVAIDIAHTLASMTYPFALQYAYNGTLEGRDERIRPLVEVECADGWMAIFIRANGFAAMCEGLDAPELITDPRFATGEARRDNFKELIAEVQGRVRNRKAGDVVNALALRRVVAACCFKPTQLGPDAPHLKARDYWQTVPTPSGVRLALGPQFRMSRTPRRAPTAPPAPGETAHAAGAADA